MIDLNRQEAIAKICVEAAEGRLAENIITLRVSEISSIADYFILATANSDPHIRAVTNAVEKELFGKMKVKCKCEGSPESQWVLLDCDGTVLMHIMTPEFRAKFQLEDLWSDARKEKKPAAKKATARKTVVKKTGSSALYEKPCGWIAGTPVPSSGNPA